MGSHHRGAGREVRIVLVEHLLPRHFPHQLHHSAAVAQSDFEGVEELVARRVGQPEGVGQWLPTQIEELIHPAFAHAALTDRTHRIPPGGWTETSKKGRSKNGRGTTPPASAACTASRTPAAPVDRSAESRRHSAPRTAGRPPCSTENRPTLRSAVAVPPSSPDSRDRVTAVPAHPSKSPACG